MLDGNMQKKNFF